MSFLIKELKQLSRSAANDHVQCAGGWGYFMVARVAPSVKLALKLTR